MVLIIERSRVLIRIPIKIAALWRYRQKEHWNKILPDPVPCDAIADRVVEKRCRG